MSEVAEPEESGADPDPGLEAAVKGIAQGIFGKLKEITGELIEDPQLEQDGIVQQLDGKIRRAGAESQVTQEPSGSTA